LEEEWILGELDKWKYDGTYNSRGISVGGYCTGGWLRHNPLGTLEFRVGNMTFDYEVILGRILSATRIVKKIKDKIEGKKVPEYRSINTEAQLTYQKSVGNTVTILNYTLHRLNKHLSELVIKEEINPVPQEEIVIRKRIHRVGG
jgi:hypothetical protein